MSEGSRNEGTRGTKRYVITIHLESCSASVKKAVCKHQPVPINDAEYAAATMIVKYERER
ncbi:hypothetical protein Pla52o_17040 [Novipirellula galeiformis]|uniref:Uncharacterized protein n=1 Tax=Novipirellula galeiformis TaxID=2528004 RepID=A0A5C6CKK0_9BACT|nr:hypothetical protein Pla52o_17040 [Novipirellula galeiformis]